jgi:hypothetical protein
MKIIAYNFAAFPLFFVEVVKFSQEIDWFAIIPSYHHREILENALGKDKVLYLQEHLNKEMHKLVVMDELSKYPGSIYSDIGADKAVLKHKPKEYQLKNAFHTYRIYKEFIKKTDPDLVFFPIIETHDAMILYKVCQELGVKTALYVHARNLGGSFLSPDCFESLPQYILDAKLDPQAELRAEKFISDFRKNFKPPSRSAVLPEEKDLISWSKPPFISRSSGYLRCTILNEEPHHISESTFSQKVKVNLLPITKKVRKAKGEISRKFCDIRSLEELPDKCIYYPLHLTPESSINTPAPFFVDQLRAIDLILYGMPSDHLLVVKEHPAVLGMRSFSFYEELKKRPGVVFADAFIPSIEIVKRASLTISVTGTACLEAFILGLPSMHLGKAFFSDYISSGSHIDLGNDIRSAIARRPAQKEAKDLISRVFMAASDFTLADPTDPYLDMRLVMNRKNMRVFLNTLISYVKETEKHMLVVKRR